MENENKRDEVFQETEDVTESVEETVSATEDIESAEVVAEVENDEAALVDDAEECSVETTDAVPEENSAEAETEEGDDIIGDEWKTDAEGDEAVDCAEDEPVYEELSEEELAAIAALKARKKKRGIVATLVVLLVIAVAALLICYTEGVGGNTIVNNPLTVTEAEDEGFLAKLKTDNIKYENPVVTLFDKVTGKNKDSALKINGIAVDKDVLAFVSNSSGLNCVYTLMQMGMLTDVNSFDWNGIDETSGISYKELAKGMAIETLVPIYATISEGEKNGIVLDEADEKQITDWIAEQKANYGDEFEEVLKASGYADEETLYEIQRIQLYMQKVYEDIEKDISKYATTEQVIKHLDDEKVTVKHILVQFEEDEEGNVTDEAKAAAKKEAEEVLAKVKAGEDFDELIEKYNDDPGATAEGYTFANDGTMVQEFTDASFALEVGGVSEIVETSYGYHIIKRMERAVTVDEYIQMLQKTVDVSIKKNVYDNMEITIDLNEYFGAAEEQNTAEPEAEAE